MFVGPSHGEIPEESPYVGFPPRLGCTTCHATLTLRRGVQYHQHHQLKCDLVGFGDVVYSPSKVAGLKFDFC